MNIKFEYNEDRDIDCLLSYGPGSNNSPGKQTPCYQELLVSKADLKDRLSVRDFVRSYIKRYNFDIEGNLQSIRDNWSKVESGYISKAESIFGISIDKNITAYLTVAGRFPYGDNHFYVSAKKTNNNLTAMHELWHFYTWKKFGHTTEKIGHQKYNDIKESLSVIINLELKNILNGEVDNGYPQHQEMRKKISDLWLKSKNIDLIWEETIK